MKLLKNKKKSVACKLTTKLWQMFFFLKKTGPYKTQIEENSGLFHFIFVFKFKSWVSRFWFINYLCISHCKHASGKMLVPHQ